jgi:hypothetical protein
MLSPFICIRRAARIPLAAWLAVHITLCCFSLTASAASLESLISPGPLSEAHAEYEDSCGSCHKFFKQGEQTKLCLDCHEETAKDITEQVNFHGKNPGIVAAKCSDCHTEHEGRDFDTSGLIPETFDHNLTEFELTFLHEHIQCNSCHIDDTNFRDTPNECIGCHQQDDAHKSGLGDDCEGCHSPEGWTTTHFDHKETSGYKLLGAHTAQPCTACHLDHNYEATPQECVDCHKIDDIHNGQRGGDCASCHTESDWKTSVFEHEAETDFALLGSHSDLECKSCHLDNMSLSEPPTTCVGCHSSDDVHLGQRGTACDSCHTNTTWKIEFDHKAKTGFALLGAHTEQTCDSCHTNGMEEQLPTDCEGCHTDNDPHHSTLGACDSCHKQTSWLENIRFDHEFTSFPLVGFHNVATCDQCHSSLRFEDVFIECYECHQSEDKHEKTFGEVCSDCHNPGGWELWSFDHSTQTNFELLGAHENLICASCHNNTGVVAKDTSSECISCHLSDDQHQGQFGKSCDRCHTTTSFDENVRFR